MDECSCGFTDHVNEDDENINTYVTQEKDQRSILIIGEVHIFLPIIPTEASAQVVDVAKEEVHPVVNVIEEKEEILKCSLAEIDEHTVEFLTHWEMELKMLEDWLDNPEPEGGCHEIAMLGKTCQHELQLEEAGMEPAKELT